MPDAEERLEAEVWQVLTRYRVTCDDAAALVDALMLVAQRYAAGDSEIVTELRRRVLHRDTAPAPVDAP